LKQEGIEFEEIFVCPHKPEDNCSCRKPKTGLVDAFFKENRARIDMENSFMYGDRESDEKFAKNLNLKIIKATTNGKFNLDN
jgi:imidazoleglycerol-phosphate dehydratase/histidinol-phosphatase